MGKIPPLKLFFEYEEPKHSDLKVCISRKYKLPNQKNSEKIASKPASITFDSVDPYYLQLFGYIGFYSEKGCSFTMRVCFPKEDLKDKSTDKEVI